MIPACPEFVPAINLDGTEPSIPEFILLPEYAAAHLLAVVVVVLS